MEVPEVQRYWEALYAKRLVNRSRRLVVRYGLLHAVFEVLQSVVLHRPPFLWYNPRDVGPDQSFKCRWVH